MTTYWQPSLASIGAGDVPGDARTGTRQVLRAVADQQLVAVDQGLHAAQVGERRQDHGLDVGELLLGQAERQLLDQQRGPRGG